MWEGRLALIGFGCVLPVLAGLVVALMVWMIVPECWRLAFAVVALGSAFVTCFNWVFKK